VLPNSQVRQILFLLLIAILFGLIFWNLRFFMPALLGAYSLYVLLRQPYHYLTDTRHWNTKVSAALLMLASLVVILLPINALIRMVSAKVIIGLQNSDQIVQSIQALISEAESRLNMQLLTPDRVKNLTEWGIQQLSGALNATLIGFVMLLVAFVILWFMLTESKKMESSFFNWLPLKSDNIEYVRKEINDLVFSNALGIPLMGVVQGTAGFVGYYLAGVPDIWFWVVLTFISGMLPLVGVALAFVPLGLLLLSQGQTGSAVFVFLYGFFIIGSVDNLARMWLLKKIGHTHPLITLFGVIIGLQLFGFIGFIFGPILISLFILLVKIYLKEFHVKNGMA